jgi:acid phosphatase (class A)
MRKLLRALSLVFILAAYPAAAKDAYLAPSQIDVIRLLPGPPAVDSAAMTADLQAVRAAQAARTEAQIKNVKADQKRSVYRFAEVMGPGFRKENLPFADKFFKRVARNVKSLLEPAKSHFNRTRPFVLDATIKPAVDEPHDASYPSAHAAFGAAMGTLLATMVPENASAITQRGVIYGTNRVIAGAHFPTDVEAGRTAGNAIAARMMQDIAFKKDFERAKAEVRHALGKS